MMKSVKPGRKPSKMSAVGSIFVAVIGIFWCIAAGTLGAWFLIPFGLLFTCFAVGLAVYHGHNAVSENRCSIMDIVDSREDPDPLNEKYVRQKKSESDTADNAVAGNDVNYCPYCGKPVKSTFDFCPKCGKKLSD